MFTSKIIKELLQTSDTLLDKLIEAYALLPPTRCRRKTHCCSLLPGTTLVEALAVIRHLTEMAPATQAGFVQNIIRYFFINPIKITACPFLVDQDCLIYTHRFWGCRAYGLWSQTYYDKIAGQNRRAKIHLQQQWKKLGISLPREVTDFDVPYCRHVERNEDKYVDDQTLLQVAEKIETLSEQLSYQHQLFRRQYFSDLSFLISTLAFGLSAAVKMKYEIVKEIINTGNSDRLEKITGNLPNLMAELV